MGNAPQNTEKLTLAPSIRSTSEPEQLALLDGGRWWEESWKGMPEFVQEDLEPFKTVYVHFERREDMEAFAKLVGQTVTMNTRSIWYPEAEIGRYANKRYIEQPSRTETAPTDPSQEEEIEF